ncbi:MAG: hypothetical protein SFZ03_10920 [Candidatus Melainabacteria bacterium]|nr:hypothetical protein [Candidatus Melainabacteria bacterium]
MLTQHAFAERAYFNTASPQCQVLARGQHSATRHLAIYFGKSNPQPGTIASDCFIASAAGPRTPAPYRTTPHALRFAANAFANQANNLFADYPLFAQHTAQQAAQKLQQGSLRSAQDLYWWLARQRRQYQAEKTGTPASQLPHGKPRLTDATTPLTPTPEYGKRFEAEIPLFLGWMARHPEQVYTDSQGFRCVTQPYRLVSTGQLIPLTTVAQRPEDGFCELRHSPYEPSIVQARQEREWLFEQTMNPQASIGQRLHHLSNLVYLDYHLMQTERGNAAITDIEAAALAQTLGLQWRPDGDAMDLVAMRSTPNEFEQVFLSKLARLPQALMSPVAV